MKDRHKSNDLGIRLMKAIAKGDRKEAERLRKEAAGLHYRG